MANPSRISILLPVTFVLIWIALICLSMPGFAVADGPAGKHPVDGVSALNPGSELWRDVRQREHPAGGSTQVGASTAKL